MELLIKIPKEFEQHFKQDAFEDSLHRLSADVHLIAGLYEQETAAMLIESFKNAVPIPAHGRLIDADELIRKIDEEVAKFVALNEYDSGLRTGYRASKKTIQLLPTIFPADPATEGE